jgi:catechol 2,3-dioxygenase-like lactoylglutathione lyase family enzyme
LYHFAVLMPSRAALGRSIRRLADSRYPLGGASDHLVSEAFYLSDPDGIGIELYRDRPRAEWPRQDGTIRMASDPIDLEGILGEASSEPRAWTGLEPGTRVGHVHLQVADIPEAERFYVDVLGLEVERSAPTFVQFHDFAIASDERIGPGADAELYWVVEDAESAFRELSAKAPVATPLQQLPFGKVFSITDPAGRPCFLIEFAADRPSKPER